MPAKKRPVGRPKTRPEGATPLAARFSPDERKRINAVAKRAGISAAEWMRRTVIRAAFPEKHRDSEKLP